MDFDPASFFAGIATTLIVAAIVIWAVGRPLIGDALTLYTCNAHEQEK